MRRTCPTKTPQPITEPAATSGHPDIGTGDRQCGSHLCPLCSTTVSDLSVDEIRHSLAHHDTVLHARRHLLPITPGHGSSPVSTSSFTTTVERRDLSVLNEVWPSHCMPMSVSHHNMQIELSREPLHQKKDRCCACPKSMIVSALDYITPVCYATPPALGIARDIFKPHTAASLKPICNVNDPPENAIMSM